MLYFQIGKTIQFESFGKSGHTNISIQDLKFVFFSIVEIWK